MKLTQYQYVVRMQEALTAADLESFLNNLHCYIGDYYDIGDVSFNIGHHPTDVISVLNGDIPFTENFLHSLLKEVNLILKVEIDYTAKINKLLKDR